jgi:cytidine deaminase
LKALYDVASEARKNSYSPYSQQKVGAAVRANKKGQATTTIFGGCNVENSSYGACCCAEQTAIHTAVAALGPEAQILEVLVITDADPAWPPCGICRQVITEFAQNPDIPIHCTNLAGKTRTQKLSELIPQAFGSDYLKK